MDISERSLALHRELKGKLEIKSRASVDSREALSLAYTPGVAEPCLRIQKDIDESFLLTRRWNTVAVITDGTAVLGLGDIGPEAGMPVMEGKCVLFKEFGGVDAIPLCVRTKDADEFVLTVKNLLGSFGGVNLEDISAPRCFEIEEKLKAVSDIPIFHDDQHGTAVCVLAALINALKLVDKDIASLKAVICGAGAAGIAIAKLLMARGLKDVTLVGSKGIITKDMKVNSYQKKMAEITNPDGREGGLEEALRGADLFIGVSKAGLLTETMVQSMNRDAIIFAMANPVPEIMPELAKKAGAKVIGTGRSDFPNQINNVLVFPHIFRGALDTRATEINDEMKIAAAEALASLVAGDERNPDYILPQPFDKRVGEVVSKAVAEAAIKSGVARVKA